MRTTYLKTAMLSSWYVLPHLQPLEETTGVCTVKQTES